MRKLVILVLAIAPQLLFSQEKYESYKSDYFSKTYAIDLGKPSKTGDYKFYIETKSKDKLSKQASLLVSSKEIPQLVEFLRSAKEIYLKWTKTAKENNVTDLDKMIDIKSPSLEGAFSYGSWHFDYNVRLNPRYKIFENKYLLIIDSGELQSSSNQFTKSDGFYFVFNSSEEIDSLILSLDLEKANAFIKNSSNKDSLFN